MVYRIRQVLLFCSVFLAFDTEAQKHTESRSQVWLGYFNQVRLSDRSGVWIDLQYRTNDFLEEGSSSILRTGYTYYGTEQFRLTAGYGYITHYSLTSGMPDVPEHRLWQQVQWFDRRKGSSLSQYFRVEQRHVRKVSNGELTGDSNFTWRFRYNFAISIPLKGDAISPDTPFLFLNDEVLINAGKNVVNNYFDQNRLLAGVGYQFTANTNVIVGYLNVFQQLPAGDHYVNIHGVRLMVFHNLDLRRK